jgi:hypothetical protein
MCNEKVRKSFFFEKKNQKTSAYGDGLPADTSGLKS